MFLKNVLNQLNERFSDNKMLMNKVTVQVCNLLFKPGVDIPFDVYKTFDPTLLKTFRNPNTNLSGYIITHRVVESNRIDYFKDILKVIQVKIKSY